MLAASLLAIGSAVVLPPVLLGRQLNASWTAMLPGLVTLFALAGLMETRRGRAGELVGDLLTVRSWVGSRTIDLSALKYVRCWRTATRSGDFVFYSMADRTGARVVLDDRAGAARMIREFVKRDREDPGQATIRVSRQTLAELGLAPRPRLTAGMVSNATVILGILALFAVTTTAAELISSHRRRGLRSRMASVPAPSRGAGSRRLLIRPSQTTRARRPSVAGP